MGSHSFRCPPLSKTSHWSMQSVCCLQANQQKKLHLEMNSRNSMLRLDHSLIVAWTHAFLSLLLRLSNLKSRSRLNVFWKKYKFNLLFNFDLYLLCLKALNTIALTESICWLVAEGYNCGSICIVFLSWLPPKYHLTNFLINLDESNTIVTKKAFIT